jgi:hypothetical protein
MLFVAAPRLARARLQAEARRHHCDVDASRIRFGWFAVYLDEVVVRPLGWPGVEAKIRQVRVPLTLLLRPQGIYGHGGAIEISGSAPDVLQNARRWRSLGEHGDGQAEPTFFLPVSMEDISARWSDGATTIVEMAGLDIHRDSAGTRFDVRSGACHLTRRRVTAVGGTLQLRTDLSLANAHVASVSIAADQLGLDSVAAPAANEAEEGAPQPVDAGRPLLSLPDLHGVRTQAAAILSMVSERIPPGAEFNVDAMTFELGDGSPRGALTIGPGAFSVTRSASTFEVRFTRGGNGSPSSLAVTATLPVSGGGDLTVLLQGGPVTLSALGVREGQWGLLEEDHATVTGRIQVALAGDGGALTFDADGAASGLALQQPRLAPETDRGLDIALRARGVATSVGLLRVVDFAASLGAIHVSASGLLDQEADHVSGSFRMEVASAPCQSLLDSLPTSLLPALMGAKVGGSLGARGQISFDTRTLDDLRLDYDLRDDCHVTEVAEPLSKEHFHQPFSHRVYLPDGSLSEHETGPGTKDWTPLEAVSPYVQVAVLTTEDGAFLRHRGFNRSAIRASLIADLKARRFVRGASTITMQLAKNLFLSRQKTISRKLEEVVLTEYLEQAFSKEELMELYLNVIEFGPNVYGIGPAATYYFGRTPAELNLAESLFLSSLLPAPIRYSRMHDAEQAPEGWMRTLRATMQMANKRGLISDDELAEARDESVVFWHGGARPEARPPVRARTRLDGSDAGSEFQAPMLAP